MLDRKCIKPKENTKFAAKRKEVLNDISKNRFDTSKILEMSKYTRGKLRSTLCSIAKAEPSTEQLWLTVELIALDLAEKQDLLTELSKHI